VIEQEKLIANAAETGNYLMGELRKIPQLKRVRGKGLMIGFDLPDDLKDLRKDLLFSQRIFTGEAKPNTIRLLPSLALRKKDADAFLEAIQEEITAKC
jgi:acetylornithine aminotransferase